MRIAVLLVSSFLYGADLAQIAALDVERTPRQEKLTTGGQTIEKSISGWSRDTRIKVEDEAKGEITASFDKALAAYPTLEKEPFLGWLVEGYLFDLRDHPKLQQHAGTKLISNASIAAYPVDAYVSKFSATLSTNPGRLQVFSKPEGAVISIDGNESGITSRSFMVSPGAHLVTLTGVVKCSQSVTVGSGKTVRVYCPSS
jgi:hypothetical protein